MERRNGKVNGFMSFKDVPAEAPTRRTEICAYCRSDRSEACLTECLPRQRYHKFSPIPLDDWDSPPPIPRVEEVQSCNASERLVYVLMAMSYIREIVVRNRRT